MKLELYTSIHEKDVTDLDMTQFGRCGEPVSWTRLEVELHA